MGRIASWGAALGLGAVWWWAVLRILLGVDAGLLEGTIAAGGWGLSLLPVHVVPKTRAVGSVEAGRWVAAWRAGRVSSRGGRSGAGPGAA
ncbi:hypothetical protein [Streptomyces sp. V3I7]|uniref:hypothetical protein n=1 Tax=Streptomyces sp. V3I7 TaxID=3042278 RepID=UPI0027D7FC36|nr:hypothetical protein [Streptomyces sp. V3I7]